MGYGCVSPPPSTHLRTHDTYTQHTHHTHTRTHTHTPTTHTHCARALTHTHRPHTHIGPTPTHARARTHAHTHTHCSPHKKTGNKKDGKLQNGVTDHGSRPHCFSVRLWCPSCPGHRSVLWTQTIHKYKTVQIITSLLLSTLNYFDAVTFNSHILEFCCLFFFRNLLLVLFCFVSILSTSGMARHIMGTFFFFQLE